MSKRIATNELTDRNWDQEEESEEAGTFQQASDESMKKRQIIKAKRRTNLESNESTPAGAFTGFSGFGKVPISNFKFDSSKTLSGIKTDKLENNEKHPDTPRPTFLKPQLSSNEPVSAFSLKNGNEELQTNKEKFLLQLEKLNKSVNKWITDHVIKNPKCILTPIFKDYENYLADLEKKYPSSEENSSTQTDKCDVKDAQGVKSDISQSEPKSGFSFNISPAKTNSTEPDKKLPGFSFNKESNSLTNEPEKKTSGFSFNKDSNTLANELEKKTSGFSFNKDSNSSTNEPEKITSGFTFNKDSSTKSFSENSTSGFPTFKPGAFTGFSSLSGNTASSGFTFGSNLKPASTTGGNSSQENEDEEYVPPKVEVETVKEDDAFYTKRCKLFYQKDAQWTERGVGNLHLKHVNEKIQLIIRADTTLGNILLNIILNESIPIKKQGKNNVFIMCIPNPPIDSKKEDEPKPVSMLIRVKTSEDAEELIEKMTPSEKDS